MQGPIPEVLMPAGVDLAKLGEIGLRKLGMPALEAREFAKKVDWNTTLVVPVPPTATRFREVLVGSSRGVEIEGPRVDPETGGERATGICCCGRRAGVSTAFARPCASAT